ncbi:hypothetical protein ACIRU8_00670 [Streptomyces sp. NPDC101175]|uniref:hypothetical protein n=1 Tax=Streptomyces sp. NPDC101175 TaxID=3366123 RepID=UPI003833B9EC
MSVYGQGAFDGFLSVEPPVQEVYPLDASATVRGATDNAQYTAEETEFDRPELLIAWGSTVDADLLCWWAESPDPNAWTTVIWRRQWLSWDRFDFGMSEFLRRFAARDLPEVWTFDLPYDGCRFVHDRDSKRLRALKIDPWGPEPVARI